MWAICSRTSQGGCCGQPPIALSFQRERAATPSRFSLPFFLHPQGAMPLDPIMGDKDAHPRWTAAAFLDHRLNEIGLK